MVQTRTVLKVDIGCEKCKKNLLRAVTGLQCVDKIEVDAAKGLLTVTGDADPCQVIVRARKACKYAEVVTIGPPPAPPKKEAQKKPDQNKSDQKAHVHSSDNCPECQRIAALHMARWDEPNVPCSIL